MTAILFEHADVTQFLEDVDEGVVMTDAVFIEQWLSSRTSDEEDQRIRLALAAVIADLVAPSESKPLPPTAQALRAACTSEDHVALTHAAWKSVNDLLGDGSAAVWKAWGPNIIAARRHARFIRARLDRAWRR